MHFCFIGPPGSGKSTQSHNLEYDLDDAEHITTSDALRQDTRALEYINRGELVPDDLSCKILAATLSEVPLFVTHVILDGFPRAQKNVTWIENYTNGNVAYIVFDVSKETCFKRLAERNRDDLELREYRHQVYLDNAALLLQHVPLERIITLSGESSANEVFGVMRDAVYDRFLHTSVITDYLVFGRMVIGIQKGKSHKKAMDFYHQHIHEWKSIMGKSIDGVDVIDVKPRDGAKMLKEGIIDIFIGTEDAPLYVEDGDDVMALFPPEIPHPEIKRADDSTPRLAYVTNPDNKGRRLLTEYPGVKADGRYVKEMITNITGSAEGYLKIPNCQFAEAFVVVETGATLRQSGLVETEHVKYIGINAFVNRIFLFNDLAIHRNAFHVSPTSEILPGMVPDPHAPDFDMSHLKTKFPKLPLVIKGESKEVRYVGGGLVAIKFLPTLYSFSKNRAGVVEGTDDLRLEMCKKMQEVLRLGGVPHAYIKIDHGFVLAHLVIPSLVEFYKYNQVVFSPHDLTEKQLKLVPRCPPVEVIVKKYLTGTCKHKTYALDLCKVREQHPLAGMPFAKEDVLPEPIVRIDHRNPLRDKDGSRMADYTPGDELMDFVIDTKKAKMLVRQAQTAIDFFLNKCDIVNLDLCFNGITEDGSMMTAEISQDVGRFRHYHLGSLDKDIWRAGGSNCNEEILAKWKAMTDMIRGVKVDRIPAMMPSTPPLRIAFGTTNPWKIRELNALLLNVNKVIKTYSFDIPEPHYCLQKNALAKMYGYINHIPLNEYDLLIVEDSGLFVDALDGAPGARSARYCVEDEETETRTRTQIDRANNVMLLEAMRGMPNRSAHFEVVALMYSSKQMKHLSFSSQVHGTIADASRGTNGFGYDPVFIPEGKDDLTFGELDGHRKNLRSHRREVAASISRYISNIYIPLVHNQ